MLLLLLPEQVSEHWDKIKLAVEKSLPPLVGEGPEKMNNILMSLLDGYLQCWLSFRDDGREGVGFVITSILSDRCSDTNSLLLYCIYGFKKTKGSDWIEGYEALRKFAKSRGCYRIVAYTKEENLIRIAERFGGDTYTFISVPI
uniref:N-acetyltransferase domain-containing protein n=1 Tax=viral metagenome TaxID=1070528 RepID=A0A6M3JA18_9ZZZZ